MRYKYCVHCWYKIPLNAKFCRYCGARQPPLSKEPKSLLASSYHKESHSSQHQHRKKKRPLWEVIIFWWFAISFAFKIFTFLGPTLDFLIVVAIIYVFVTKRKRNQAKNTYGSNKPSEQPQFTHNQESSSESSASYPYSNTNDEYLEQSQSEAEQEQQRSQEAQAIIDRANKQAKRKQQITKQRQIEHNHKLALLRDQRHQEQIAKQHKFEQRREDKIRYEKRQHAKKQEQIVEQHQEAQAIARHAHKQHQAAIEKRHLEIQKQNREAELKAKQQRTAMEARRRHQQEAKKRKQIKHNHKRALLKKQRRRAKEKKQAAKRKRKQRKKAKKHNPDLNHSKLSDTLKSILQNHEHEQSIQRRRPIIAKRVLNENDHKLGFKLEREKHSMNYIDSLKGLEFEEYTAKLLKKLNYTNVLRTSASGDHGLDVIASKNGVKYGIQCKLYSPSEPVGYRALEETFTGVAYYNVDQGIVLTTSHFTKQAEKSGIQLNLKLWDRSTLKYLISEAEEIDYLCDN